jgi:hypothetical protein
VCVCVCVCVWQAYNDGKKTTFESALTIMIEGVRSWRLNVCRGTEL